MGNKGLLFVITVKGKDTCPNSALNQTKNEMIRDPDIAEGQAIQTIITHNVAYQADDLDAYDSDCDELNTAKVALMANLSHYGSDALAEVHNHDNVNNNMINQAVQAMQSSEQSNVMNHSETKITSDSNIIPYSQYVIESQQAAVQNSNSSAQQDALILSVIEQLKTQVVNCTKINLDNKSVNDTLTAELERYKEQVKVLKEGQNVDLRSNDNVSDSSAQSVEIDRLKRTLSEHLKEKESLMQTVTLLKNDFKKEESRNIDREIALEKKIKQLDNIVFKRDQSAQTVHMLTKPQFFYDHTTKQALGFQNPFYLKKAQQLEPKLYDGNVIKNTSVPDSEETLMLAEESRSKMLLKQKDPMMLEKKVNTTPVNYANSMNSPDPTLSSRPTKVEVPKELPKVKQFNTVLKKLKLHLAGFDMVVKERTTTTAITEGSWGVSKLIAENKHLKQTYKQLYDSIKPVRIRSKEQCDGLINQVNLKSMEISDLNARLQEKVFLIAALKDELRKLKGKSLVDNDVTKHTIDPEMLKNDHSKLNANSKLKCVKCNGCMLSDNHDLCVLDFVNNVNARVKSKSVKKNSKIKVWKPTGKVLKSVSANKKKPIQSWGSIVSDVPSSSLDECRSSKWFSGTVKFRNDHMEKILGYGDYQIRNVTISRVYYAEGLGDNLFSVGVNGKKYILIIVNDYSRFTWVKCLRLKDEAPDFIIKFLKMIQAKAVATACYTQNCSIVRLHYGKTPYELLHDKLPDLSFFHVFGALCYPTNDSEKLGKLQPKADIDFDELTAMASEHSSSGPALHEMTPATISSGLDLLFQLLFDELLTPPPSVDHPDPKVIAPINEVVAPVPVVSTGSPSSTTVDQDAPSPSNSQSTPETQSHILPNDVEEDNHDLDVGHMNNDSFFGITIPKNDSDASSSDVIPTVVQTAAPYSEHVTKWTKDHPLENIIGELKRPVSTRLQLHEQALFCYYDA
ncbi:retrovirus-related pol polyprotein from transposon TNT 1-94 [Tanacetum coccineum]